MSVLLQALERAEQERAVVTFPNGFDGNGNGIGFHPSDPFADYKPAGYEPARAEPSASSPSEQDEPPAFDIPSVRTCPWNPALARLPALHETGRTFEQFRKLQSRMVAFRELDPLKSILVCSAMPEEGKTFTAANLALSLARHASARVLLIDADLRGSSLHDLLGCPNQPGLSEYLAGNADLFEVLQCPAPDPSGAPLPPGLASLSFIPAGNDGAASLSGSPRFNQLLAEASPHFDWIVIDSSSISLGSEAVALASACDGVLIVVRTAVTQFEQTQQALGALKSSSMLGVVLNDAKPETTSLFHGS
jgi:capsular exopolysaccharide synthesis family protein